MAISIRDLEEAAAGGWRAPEETRMKGDWSGQGRWVGGGGWLLRAACGFTGRANSALASGDPGMPLADALAEISRWYAARGLPAMVSVPYPTDDPHASPVDRLLAGLGWPVRSGAATVMTAASAAVADAAAGAAAAVRVDLDAEPDEPWLARYRFRGQPLPPIARQLLLSAPWPQPRRTVAPPTSTCRSWTTTPSPGRCIARPALPTTTATTTASPRTAPAAREAERIGTRPARRERQATSSRAPSSAVWQARRSALRSVQ